MKVMFVSFVLLICIYCFINVAYLLITEYAGGYGKYDDLYVRKKEDSSKNSKN